MIKLRPYQVLASLYTIKHQLDQLSAQANELVKSLPSEYNHLKMAADVYNQYDFGTSNKAPNFVSLISDIATTYQNQLPTGVQLISHFVDGEVIDVGMSLGAEHPTPSIEQLQADGYLPQVKVWARPEKLSISQSESQL